MSLGSRRPGEKVAFAAVALAAAALWITFGIYYETQYQLRQLIDTVGGNVFYIYQESREHFSDEDVISIRKLLPDSEAVGACGLSKGISPDEKYSLTYVEAVADYFGFFRLEFKYGRPFSPSAGHEAILGAEVAEAIYGDTDPIGQTLESFTIVGVLENISSEDILRRRMNAHVFVPLGMSPGAAFQRDKNPYSSIYIRANIAIPKAFAKLLSLFPGLESTSATRLHSLAFTAERVTNRTLIISAYGMLLLAGTAIAGTTALSAVSRRREIGIRMAIGASSFAAFRELMKDGVYLSLTAGAYGIVAGAIVHGIAKLMGIGLSMGLLHLSVLPTTLAFGFLASLYPSWRNCLMGPVHALRGGVVHTIPKWLRIDSGHVLVALTLLASTVSITTFLNIGSGVLKEIQHVWGGVDNQLILVSSPSESFLTPPFLALEDRAAIEALLGIDTAIPSVNILTAMKGLNSQYIMIRGVDSGYEKLKLLPIVEGRDLSAEELADGAQVAIISELFAATVFREGPVLDQTLQADERAYIIVGTFSSDTFHSITQSQVVVPYRSLSRIDRELASHDFLIRVSDGFSTATAANLIISRLQEVHVGKAKVDILNPSETEDHLLVRFLALMSRLIILVCFAIFLSLANAITHIRYDLALRSREISIRKAVGATDWGILKLGIGSALIPGIPAILCGLLLGRFTTPLLVNYLGQSAIGSTWSMSVLTVAIVTCVAIGSGILGAWRSARISPVEGIQKGRT